TDTIYYLQEGKIMALQGHGPAREAACAPFESSYYANAQGFICQGLYYNFDEGGPYWRQVDSAQAVAEPLKVYGLAYDKGAQRFTRENPQTPLESISPWWTLSEIKMALASGLPTIDALLVDHVSTLNALVDQELAADLSQHPGVRAFVESCSPQVQAQVMRDGKIYALPLEINGSCLAYDAQVLKAMGLTENDLPRTYEELFAFLTRWNRQWAEEPYLPMDPWGLRSSVFYAMLNAYEDAYTLAGKELTFDTALFRRLTKGLKDMDLSNIEISDWENAALMEALQEKASLFADYSLTDAISQPDLVPWPLALEGSAPAPIGTELRLLVIPAKTTQPLAAAQLLNCYLAAMEPAAQALLSPNAAQPLEDPRYEESLTFWQAQLVRLKARQAEGALDLSSQIAPLEDRLNRPEAYRYILSPQSLALCQERILPHLYLRREISILNASYDDATGFTDLEQKFLLGEISPSQFVKDMERKLRMARLALK
ncbi:MAG: carbohydrate ABC transporter substrate-binding protein, partial [Clostridia bacterium]|nr:carbohydrate ABC transporter substrate-binding protein [Clostridia bacterium]